MASAHRRRSHLMLLLVLALVAAACGGATDGDPGSDGPAGSDAAGPTSTAPGTATSPAVTVTVTTVADGALPSGPSALRDMRAEAFPPPLIDPGEILSGGPPPDGIPPIDDPQFVSVAEADAWLEDDEPVVWLDINGDVRAYPVQILIWHEIVNDTVGGVPVAVTYCPLCNSAVTYVRVIDGVETTFGTSGRLYYSALVMYDRATESLWTHYDGRAVIGILTGTRLEPIPSPLIAWGDLKAAHPDALVLDRERTGHRRPYGENPYVGYDKPDGNPFLFRGDADARATLMQRVVGVALGDEAKAYALDLVAATDAPAKATNDEVGGEPIVILWKAGQASALESFEIDGGRDVGSVGVFSAIVDGQRLTFEATEDGRFVDAETGTTWDITGRAVDGPLAGDRLTPIHHLDTFWFAWSSYQPDTTLVAP